MAYVIHHNDDDGRCAAAIVSRELISVFDTTPPDHYFEYSHGTDLDINWDEIHEHSNVFIVDLALDEYIISLMEKFIEKKCKIVFIDHHQTSANNIEHAVLKNENVTWFVQIGVSATLLTWIFSSMNDVERATCHGWKLGVEYDFTSDMAHFAFYPGTDKQTPDHNIPSVIRYINDWDVWNHEFPETRYFNLAFGMVSDKSPTSDVWDTLIYGDGRYLYTRFIEPGKQLFDYQESLNRRAMKRAFLGEFRGLEEQLGLFLNQTGASLVFGDSIKDYDFVCLFYYDGKAKLWKYSLYSHEEKGIDVEPIARRFGGGGHKHASGFQSTECIVIAI